jgi:hypothetical protein
VSGRCLFFLAGILRLLLGNFRRRRLRLLFLCLSSGSGRLSDNALRWRSSARSILHVCLDPQVVELLQTIGRGLGSLLLIGTEALKSIMFSLLALKTCAVAKHGNDLLCVGGSVRLLLSKGARSSAKGRLTRATKVEAIHHAGNILFTKVAQHVHSGADGTQSRYHTGPESVVHEASDRRSWGRCLSRGWLVAAWRGDATIAWLAVETVGAGVVLKLVRQDTAQLGRSQVDRLLRSQMLLLSSHEILLLLLPTLEGVLLLCSKGGSKAWEAVCERRLGARSGTSSSSPCVARLSGGWTVWDSDLGYKERLTRVSNSTNELRKRLVVGLLLLFD